MRETVKGDLMRDIPSSRSVIIVNGEDLLLELIYGLLSCARNGLIGGYDYPLDRAAS